MRRTLTLGLLTAAAVATAAVASAAPSKSPQSELASMRRAVLSRHAVHYVAVDREPSYKSKEIFDVGHDKGVEQVTITEYGQTGPAQVRVMPKVAYIKGTKFTLDVFFGFSPAQAKTYAGKWISIPRADPAYKVIADGVTFESFESDVFPVAPLFPANSGRLVGVRGAAGAANQEKTVLAPNHGEPLIVKAITSRVDSKGTNTWRMSHWNEAVRVSAPAHAVPISKVTSG